MELQECRSQLIRNCESDDHEAIEHTLVDHPAACLAHCSELIVARNCLRCAEAFVRAAHFVDGPLQKLAEKLLLDFVSFYSRRLLASLLQGRHDEVLTLAVEADRPDLIPLAAEALRGGAGAAAAIDTERLCKALYRGGGSSSTKRGSRLLIVKVLMTYGGLDVNQTTENGTSVLQCAIEHGDGELVEYLLSRKEVELNGVGQALLKGDYTLRLPLFKKIVKACMAEIDQRRLIQQIIDQDAIDHLRLLVDELKFPLDDSDLIRAAMNSSEPAITRFLLQRHLAVNFRNKDGLTVLHMACIRRRPVDIIRTLLEFSTEDDVNLGDADGATALHRAVDVGRLEIVRVLVEEGGADLNQRDARMRTPLHYAVDSRGPEPVLEYLISRGADIFLQDNEGFSAFHIACSSLSVPEQTLLPFIATNEDVINLPTRDGRLPIHLALRDAKRLDYLIRAGADINQTDDTGATMMHRAAKIIRQSQGHQPVLESVRFLINKHDADLSVRDNEGQLPLTILIHDVREAHYTALRRPLEIFLPATFKCDLENFRFPEIFDAFAMSIFTASRSMILFCVGLYSVDNTQFGLIQQFLNLYEMEEYQPEAFIELTCLHEQIREHPVQNERIVSLICQSLSEKFEEAVDQTQRQAFLLSVVRQLLENGINLRHFFDSLLVLLVWNSEISFAYAKVLIPLLSLAFQFRVFAPGEYNKRAEEILEMCLDPPAGKETNVRQFMETGSLNAILAFSSAPIFPLAHLRTLTALMESNAMATTDVEKLFDLIPASFWQRTGGRKLGRVFSLQKLSRDKIRETFTASSSAERPEREFVCRLMSLPRLSTKLKWYLRFVDSEVAYKLQEF